MEEHRNWQVQVAANEALRALQSERDSLEEKLLAVDVAAIEKRVRQEADSAHQRALTAQRNVSDRRIRELEDANRALKSSATERENGKSSDAPLDSSDSLSQQLDLANSEIASLKLSLEREHASLVSRRQDVDSLRSDLEQSRTTQRALSPTCNNRGNSQQPMSLPNNTKLPHCNWN